MVCSVRISLIEARSGIIVLKILYVPAFFEHIDMNDDFNGAGRFFNRKELLDIRVTFRAGNT